MGPAPAGLPFTINLIASLASNALAQTLDSPVFLSLREFREVKINRKQTNQQVREDFCQFDGGYKVSHHA
jgi:hypothetical protein